MRKKIIKIVFIPLTCALVIYCGYSFDVVEFPLKKEMRDKHEHIKNIPQQLHEISFLQYEPGYVYYHEIASLPHTEYSLAKEFTSHLLKLLFNNDSYLLNSQKRAVFIPDIQFDFISPGGLISITLSKAAKKLKIGYGYKSIYLDIDPSFDLWCELIGKIKEQENKTNEVH